MNIFRTKLTLLAAIPVVALGLLAAKANAAPAARQISVTLGAGQDRPWDAPPPDFDDMNRRAFHDGLDAARFDAQNGRRMDPDGSRNFRRPPVPREFRDRYRAAFARGYQTARQRMGWMHEHPDHEWDHDHDHWPR